MITYLGYGIALFIVSMDIHTYNYCLYSCIIRYSAFSGLSQQKMYGKNCRQFSPKWTRLLSLGKFTFYRDKPCSLSECWSIRTNDYSARNTFSIHRYEYRAEFFATYSMKSAVGSLIIPNHFILSAKFIDRSMLLFSLRTAINYASCRANVSCAYASVENFKAKICIWNWWRCRCASVALRSRATAVEYVWSPGIGIADGKRFLLNNCESIN